MSSNAKTGPASWGNSPDRTRVFDARAIATIGMLTAVAYAVMVACKVIPPIGGFLSFDLKDTVMVIGGIFYGPAAALCMAVLVPLVEFLTVSDTGPIGLVMNIVATAAFVCPAVMLYRRKHDTKHAVLGLVVGTVCLTAIMVLWNYALTPIFYKMPRKAVVDLMPMIIGFNIVKGVCNAALIMLLYPPVSTALRKVGLVAPSKGSGAKAKFNYTPMVISAVVLVTGVLFLLAMLEII